MRVAQKFIRIIANKVISDKADKVISNIWIAIEVVNSKSDIKHNSEYVHRRTSYVQHCGMKFMITISRLGYSSETIANLNPRVPTWQSSSEKEGECPVNAACITKSQQDPCTLLWKEEISRNFSMQFVAYTKIRIPSLITF